MCRRCQRHVAAETRICPHCGANVIEADSEYSRRLKMVRDNCAQLGASVLDLAASFEESESREAPSPHLPASLGPLHPQTREV
jgi:predicted amidophosphoribosyltransferase